MTALTSAMTIRAAAPDDADACGRIFYDAFESIAGTHNFPVEPSSPEFTRMTAGRMLGHHAFSCFVAEHSGEPVGAAFADERGPIVGVGPVVVDPTAQDAGVGRALMEALLQRSRERGAAGVRLVQTAYHHRSLSLYAKLGFRVREPLSVFQGTPPAASVEGAYVRAADEADVERCTRVCQRVHGHARTGELRDAIGAGSAVVVERGGELRGYATGFGYGWHAVADTDDDLVALLASAPAFHGLGILVPSRNSRLMEWCFAGGLRLVQQSTLMTTGLYNEPAGAWLPSIAY
jgi:GNAT superfamily N-acetyltransferase